MKKLIAYHNDSKIKDDILERLRRHYDADEIIKGRYRGNGKGFALGYTIHSGNYAEYETRFGIPKVLSRLEDSIFEGLPNELSKEWPIRFMSAVNVGSDLSQVWPKFAIWLLSDNQYGVLQYADKDYLRKVITDVCDLYQESLVREVDTKRFEDATNSAYAAAHAAAHAAAAYVAAHVADYVAYAAVHAAAYAADYAAKAADYAAEAAAKAADYAAKAADYAAEAADYASKAKEQIYIAQSEKLLELIRECK